MWRSILSSTLGWSAAVVVLAGLGMLIFGQHTGSKILAIGFALVGGANAAASGSERRPWWLGVLTSAATATCALFA